MLGAAGWMLAAGLSVAGTSTVAAALARSGADRAAQGAALHVVNIGITAALVVTAVTFGGWLVLFSRDARRVGIVGRGLSLAGIVVGALAAASAFYGFPVGLLLTIPYLLILGAALLRSAKAPVAAVRTFSAV